MTALVSALLLAALAFGGGSVPAEVAAYVADGSLVARLDEVYGSAAPGAIDFGEATTTSAVVRVSEWSGDAANPTQLVNEWIVPVSIAEEPVGLATIWINPDTVRPELAEFEPDAELAAALSDIPAAATLVRDGARGAWYALEDGVVTALVPGDSGLSTPVPLADVPIDAATAEEPVTADEVGPGLGLSAALGAVLVVAVAIAFASAGRRRARDRDLPPGDDA